MTSPFDYWYPWSPARYRADTLHLSCEEDGIYRRLIDHYMETRLPLPDNDHALARIAGCDAETISKAMAKLRLFFRLSEGKLYLKKCDETLEDQAARSHKYSENGKKGGRPKSIEKQEEKTNSKAIAKLNESTGQDKTGKDNKKEFLSEDNKLSSSSSRELNLNRKYPEEFEKLWDKWPEERRRLKPKAYKAWLKACKRVSPDYLFGCLERYLESKAVKEGFAPYPQKWLNNEEWENSPPPALTQQQAIADLSGAIELEGLMAMFEVLQKMHGGPTFRSWLSVLRVKHKNCSAITLTAPSRFMVEWLKQHYLTDINYAASQAWPQISTVDIEVVAK